MRDTARTRRRSPRSLERSSASTFCSISSAASMVSAPRSVCGWLPSRSTICCDGGSVSPVYRRWADLPVGEHLPRQGGLMQFRPSCSANCLYPLIYSFPSLFRRYCSEIGFRPCPWYCSPRIHPQERLQSVGYGAWWLVRGRRCKYCIGPKI